MRVLKGSPWLAGTGALVALAVFAVGQARADVTTDRAGSLIVFPKVIADGTRDTIIKLTNTGNLPVLAHCTYINGGGTCSGDLDFQCETDDDCAPELGTCEFLWQPQDFDVFLTIQQPTMWRVSTGRFEDPTASDDACEEATIGTCGAGADQGAPCEDDGDCDGSCENITTRQACPGFFRLQVLPQGERFRGQLVCVEIDGGGAPVSTNALKGEAFIQRLSDGPAAISAYNSINVRGGENDQDLRLELDGEEYNACPEQLVVNHLAQGADDEVANDLDDDCSGDICTIETELTLVPCTQDIESTFGTQVTVNFDIFDEFENRTSTSYELDCFANLSLDHPDLGGVFLDNDTSLFRKTVVRAQTGGRCRRAEDGGGLAFINDQCSLNDVNACGGNPELCQPASSLLGVVEQFHLLSNEPTGGTAAANLHMIGERPSDVITLPEFTVPGL